MHQGKIRAFNPVSGGAAFEILLPLKRQAVLASE
jgi:signal transduction histidine kinase